MFYKAAANFVYCAQARTNTTGAVLYQISATLSILYLVNTQLTLYTIRKQVYPTIRIPTALSAITL